ATSTSACATRSRLRLSWQRTRPPRPAGPTTTASAAWPPAGAASIQATLSRAVRTSVPMAINMSGTPTREATHGAYRSSVYVRVLGPLEVTQDNERLALGGPKQRLVLAHLVIRANQVVSSDRLIDEIWGDEPPDAARSSLQSYVSHLRSALGAQRLEGRSPGYILHLTDQEVDAARFEARTRQARGQLSGDPAAAARILREALGLWQGDPF